MNFLNIDILLYFGLAISAGAIAKTLWRIFLQFKAEIALSQGLWELAQKEHAVQRLRRFQSELQKPGSINKSLQTDFDQLLTQAIWHLEASERRLVRYGINQPSLIGKRNYELKLLTQALGHSA